MSVEKRPNRIKNVPFVKKAPYLFNKYNQINPIEVLGKEALEVTPIKYIKEIFPYLLMSMDRREVLYSKQVYDMKCLYCGLEFNIVGFDLEKGEEKHSKVCKMPLFYRDGNNYNDVKIREIYGKRHYYISVTTNISNKKIQIFIKTGNNSNILERIFELIENNYYSKKTFYLKDIFYPFKQKIRITYTEKNERKVIKRWTRK